MDADPRALFQQALTHFQSGRMHEAESLLDRARNGELRMSGAVIDAAFASCDALKKLVGAISEGTPAASQSAVTEFGELLSNLRRLASANEPAAAILPRALATRGQTAREWPNPIRSG